MHPFAPLLRTAMAGVSALLLLPGPAEAQMGGHGPDAWRVTGVTSDDVLNLRMGPGTRYPIIGSFAHDAAGLTMTTCVPFMTEAQGMTMTPEERERLNLPPRWCLMSDAQARSQGWVAARFLEEDTGGPASDQDGDRMIEDAVSLVSRLYTRHEQAMRGEALSPFSHGRAADFFFAGDVSAVADSQWQADPLYDAQDFDITNLRVYADPEMPMFRGMITVWVEFENFGQPQRVEVNLRPDPDQPGRPAPVRIIRIDHGEWQFP
ncbi:SH3 domain-containing protein [Histidinibacterium lentulum]|uniref:SH3 domain-containing protein n=1 Tax=Histidinibacterium lentulum TaxID=2480588 RepID=A0A3N2QM95_9RHOB|nr:hypothetical protein [Histidinibacterium lentulum]ROT96312.1 hypothetical protein EAT49_18935 [Histidinibacterium lentulum]